MEVKTKKSFNNLVSSLIEQILDEDEGVTTTDDIEGYMTPNAFSKKKRKRKKIGVNEGLDQKDLVLITKLIRKVVGDIYRDIWLKRASWTKI